jgi:hypothetical protein
MDVNVLDFRCQLLSVHLFAGQIHVAALGAINLADLSILHRNVYWEFSRDFTGYFESNSLGIFKNTVHGEMMLFVENIAVHHGGVLPVETIHADATPTTTSIQPNANVQDILSIISNVANNHITYSQAMIRLAHLIPTS